MSRAALFFAACLAACSSGQFEDLRDTAWADAIDLPDGVESEDYPVAIASLTTDRPGTHFVALAANPPAVATISYTVSGDQTAAGVELAEVPPSIASTIEATVAGPTAPVAGASAAIAIGGLGPRGALLVYDARTGDDGPELRRIVEGSTCGANLTDLGRYMVWTRTDLGDPDAPDLVASADGALVVFIDLEADTVVSRCVRCEIDPITAMTAGDFDPASPGDEIAIGVADPAGVAAGHVDLFHASLVETHDTANTRCFTTSSAFATIPAERADDLDFGSSLATGNSNNVDLPELAIGAPGSREVLVLTDMSTSGPTGAPQQLVVGGSSTTFGAAIAFADLDGDGADELVVGDPGATVEEETRAGNVFLFGPETMTGRVTYAPVGELRDAHPERDAQRGVPLAITRHVGTLGSTDIVLVGATHELLVYFRSLVTGSDPRE